MKFVMPRPFLPVNTLIAQRLTTSDRGLLRTRAHGEWRFEIVTFINVKTQQQKLTGDQ